MDKLNQQISLLNEIKLIENQISQIIHCSEEAIISADDKFNIILFNNGAEKIFGYKAEAILGSPLNLLIPEKFHSKHNEHMSDFSRHTQHAQLMGDKRLVLGIKKDGTEFNVEASITIISLNEKKVYTAFLRDITLRRQLETELNIAKEKFESVIRIANDAIISVDDSQNIIIFNQGAEKIFGYSDSEIIGKPIETLIPEEFKLGHSTHVKSFSEKPNHARMMAERQEIYGLRKDGIEFHAEASIANFRIDEKPIYTVILRDVTSRKLLEKQLLRYLDSLEKINDEKEKYISMLAHDLKNPFGNLLGYLNYVKNNLDELTKDEINEILQSSISSANNIYTLLESLLDWSRIQMNRISFSPDFIYLTEELDPVLSLYKTSFEQKRITLNISVKENDIVYADRNMLATILRNLISNSIKFSYENGPIDIHTSQSGDNLNIHIEDEGVGMNSEILRKLFRTDYSIHTEGTSGEGGVGIGLLLVKDFVELNNGTISIESEFHKGSKITVSLPTKSLKEKLIEQV